MRIAFIAGLIWLVPRPSPAMGTERPSVHYAGTFVCDARPAIPEACTNPNLAIDDTVSCPGRPIRPYCDVARPKEWTLAESRRFQEILDHYLSGAELRGVWRTVTARGPLRFHRFMNHAIEAASGSYVQRLALGVAFLDVQSLGFFDALFARDAEDQRVGVGHYLAEPGRDTAVVILHEVAHLYDNDRGHLHRDCDFLRAAGFDSDLRNADARAAMDGLVQEAVAGHLRQASGMNRRLGRERGFPTLYAMTSAQEAFAEILAYLALDPEARMYLRPALVEWFDRRVFSDDVRPPVPCPLKAM